MHESVDFLEECETLHGLVADLAPERFGDPTQFKGWTVDDVIGHLHLFNLAAELAVTDTEQFNLLIEPVLKSLARGETMLTSQWQWLGDCRGNALVDRWMNGSRQLAKVYQGIDPKTRVNWVGPQMSARSAITARQMETWAHGQEVFDLLGAHRQEGDRIRNIVFLGINTFGWSYSNRGLAVPDNPPFLELDLPSGERLTFNERSDTNHIQGPAVEFAQVVTQVRNVDDTNLKIIGDVARGWMEIAQCFAGPPQDPPAPGTRFASKQT